MGGAMRRRQRQRGPVPPERLCRFVAAEWPGARCGHEALSMWADECASWLAADSDAPETRPGCEPWWSAGWSRRVLPFGEFGDAIDVLREMHNYPVPSCPGGCASFDI